MAKRNENNLTDRWQVFADTYLADPDLNATKAYKAAYPKASQRTAEVNGAELLRKTEVAVYIAKAMKERSERTKIDADWMLTRLANEAEADIADLYYANGGIKPVHEWPKIWRQGLVAGLEVEQQYTMVDGERQPDGVVVKLKLSDRVKRLEMIGKHVSVQAFREQRHVEVGGLQGLIDELTGD